MRVIGVMPNTSAARTMCSTSSRLIGPCSQSIMTKSYPIAPNSSTRSGAWRLMMAPNTTLPSASLAFVVLVRMALPLSDQPEPPTGHAGRFFSLGVHHPHREGVQERPEARQVLLGEGVALGCVLEHALEAREPFLPRARGDDEGQVPRAHHRIAEALLIERRPAEEADEVRRRLLRGGHHVRGEEGAQGRLLELAVEILHHPEDVRLAHDAVDFAARRSDLAWIDVGNVDPPAHAPAPPSAPSR